MKKTQFAVVLVTAPDLKIARRLAKIILKAKLAACVNLVPKMESHYWWEEKLEKANEVLMLIKTPTKHLGELEEKILKNHPYKTPEFIVLSISSGNKRYLAWINDSVR